MFWLDWLTVIVVKVGAVVAPSLLVVAIVALLITEVVRMLSETFLRKRYEKGRQEGRQEGRREERDKLQKWAKEQGYDITFPDRDEGSRDDRRG